MKALPKVELHLHLDCSLSWDVVQKLDSKISKKAYTDNFIAPKKCRNLTDYIAKATRSIELMQTKDQLSLVVQDLIRQLVTDNIIYAEIRFAPLEHTIEGLSPEEVVETVSQTLADCEKEYLIHLGLILCTLRHYSEAQSLKTVHLVDRFQGTNVVGFDIASDEAGFPIDHHIKAFEFAYDNNIPCTAHAGEARGSDSIWETIRHFNPKRIGHGVRSIEDPELVRYLVDNNIHLEVCPTSNIQVDVFDTIQDHSVDQLYNAGVSLSINTDATTISDVTLSEEYELLEKTFGWTMAHFKKVNLEAIKYAFASDELKQNLTEKIKAAY